MFDPVKWILWLFYVYSRLLGVLNFEINMKTGQARATRKATIYALLVNGMGFSVVFVITSSQVLQSLWSNAGLLHEYLYVVIHGTRVFCVMITLLSRWWQRRKLIHLINAFRRLACRKPQVARMWRRRVIIKFMTICSTELLQALASFLTIGDNLNINLIIIIFMLSLLTALVNVVVSHSYFIMLNVYGHYILMNEELQEILTEAHSLESENRRATFMTKCCYLADRLENIAKAQSELQKLIGRTTRIFEIQGGCVVCILYLSMIASVYFTFANIYRSDGVRSGLFFNMLMIFMIITYFLDIFITIDNFYIVLDVHGDMVRLLDEFSSTLAPGLDQRLVEVIEFFQLQLRQNPLKIHILQLYNVERVKAISLLSSIVTNSLVLVQYELENS